MADVTIDELALKIDYQAGESSKGLDNLKQTVEQLKGVLSGSTTGLTKLANGLKSVSESAIGLSSVNIGKFGENLGEMYKAVSSLNTGTIGKDLTKVFKQLSNIPDINKKLDTQTLNEFTGKIKTLSTALVPLAENLKGVGNVLNTLPSKLNKVSNQTSKTTSSMSLMSKISNAINFGAMLYAGRKLGSMVAEFTSQSNKYVEDLNLFNVAMGESTQKAKEWIDTVSQALGLDPADMMRNMGVFNLMAQGFGLASDKAYIMSKNLTQLTYDVASLYNYDFDTASKKIKSAFAGELEPVKSLGFAIDQATLQQIAYANGIDKSFTSMTQAEKAQLRYIALMTQIPQIQGDMARTITSASNSLRIMKQQFTLLGREIGNIFIPLLVKIIPVAIAVTKVLTKIAKAISSLFGFTLPDLNWDSVSATTGTVAEDLDDANGSAKALRRQLAGFDELNNLTTPSAGSGRGNDILGGGFDLPLPEYDMLEGLDKGIDDLTDKVMKFFGLTEDASGKLSWSFQDMDKWAKLLAISLGALMGIKLAGKFTSFYKGASEFAGVLEKISKGKGLAKIGGFITTFGGGNFAVALAEVAGAATLVASAAYFIYTEWDKVKATFDDFVKDSGIVEQIGNITTNVSDLVGKLDTLLEKIGGIKGAFKGLGGITTGAGAFSFAGGTFAKVKSITDVFSGTSNISTGVAEGDFSQIGKGLGEIAKFPFEPIIQKANLLKNVFKNFVFKEQFDELKARLEEVGLTTDDVKQMVLGKVSEMWTELVNKAKEKPSKIGNWFKGIGTWVVESLKGDAQEIGDIFNGIWNKVTSIFELAKNYISGKLSEFGQGIARIPQNVNTTLENMRNSVVNKFEEIKNKIHNKLAEIWNDFKTFFKFPDLQMPRLPKIGLNVTFTDDGSLISKAAKALGLEGTPHFDFYAYATGGFPDTGEFFMARENGIPEMVGKIGNRTAVANNTQIVEAIEQGVYRGTASANESASATPIYNVVNIGNRKVYSGVAQNVRTENNRYGVAVLEV